MPLRTDGKVAPTAPSSQPARAGTTAGAGAGAGANGATISDTQSAFDVRRVAIALSVVLGLILLLRWLARHLFASTAAPRSGGAMRVLSRMVVSPKQQVLLLQVGRRVVVVGDSGTQMSPLGEITDPDEITALMGQISQDQLRPGTRGFGSLFGRAQDPFRPRPTGNGGAVDADPVEEPSDATADVAQSEISGLMEKIRSVSTQFRRT